MSAQIARPRGGAANIFINYRREDSAGHAGRLFDALSDHFAGRLFMDIDNLEPGVDFVDAIEQAVDSCQVLIVVIGREWLSIKNAAGRRRLDDPADFVRLEVESALARKIRVIPVLVQDTPMPGFEELPPSLAPLARRNAIELSDARWAYDVDRLARTIQEILEEKGCAPAPAPTPAPTPRIVRSRAGWLALAALVPVAALVLAFVLWRRQTPGGEVVPAPTEPSPIAGLVTEPASAAVATESPASSEPVATTAPTGEIAASTPDPARDPARDGTSRQSTRVPAVPGPRHKPAVTVPSDPDPADPVEGPAADPPAKPAAATSLPEVKITSPAAGAAVGATVQVKGTIAGLGDRIAFLCIRQGNGSLYPRGEFAPEADDRWEIQLRSSREKSFDILVVISSDPEADRVLRDQRSRDNGIAVLPRGAVLSGAVVTVRRQGKIRGIFGN